MNILRFTTHSAYPVVDTECNDKDADLPSYGRLIGLIKRDDIISMIYMKTFVNWKELVKKDQNIVGSQQHSRNIEAHKADNIYNLEPENPNTLAKKDINKHAESYEKLRELYPRYPTVADLKISEEDQDRYFLDFSLAMDVAPSRVSSSIGYPQVSKCCLTRKKSTIVRESFYDLIKVPTINVFITS